MSQKLGVEFYARDAATVARELIGKVLIRRLDGQSLRGRLVEVEAYLGQDDAASHAYRGMTLRNQVMFGRAGHIYVYFTYGMHYCMNVVTAEEGIGQAVLLRAAEPLEGLKLMQEHRGLEDVHNLCSGPAKLVQAFGVTKADNGLSLTDSDTWIEDDGASPQVVTSPRIGLSKAIDAPLRFTDRQSTFLSKPNKNRYTGR